MKTLTSLLESIRHVYTNTTISFVFPTIYIVVTSRSFEEQDDERRVQSLSKQLNCTPDEILDIARRSSAQLLLLTEEEIQNDYSFVNSNKNNHWLSIYNKNFTENINKKESGKYRIIHFYGQKGGQARSSVVGALARNLADDGHKVLVIDADIEAPTLNTIFGIEHVEIEQTLMGYAGWSTEPSYTSNPATPGVYFIGCRPTSDDWEIDYSTFALRCSLDPETLADTFTKIAEMHLETSDNFDTVLVDHRTGAANSIIPIMNALPGPCVIFSRPDNQTTWMHGIKTLLSFNPENPGAFISFSLDNQKKQGSTTESEAELKEKLLEMLSDAISEGAEDPEPLPPDELERFYIQWMYDRAFFNSTLPKTSQLQTENISSLKQLKEVLGITRPVERSVQESPKENNKTSPSGIIDETWFVESDMTRAILQIDSNLNYIFGRKGTGKSRLFKESVDRGIGLPLLAPSEYGEIDHNILNSSDSSIKSLLRKTKDNYEEFWWILISARLEAEKSNSTYKSIIQAYAKLDIEKLSEMADPINVSEQLKSRKITLLADGLETAVLPTQLRPFVDAILSCMNTIQNSSDFRQRLNIRLFLRVDLAIGTQNIEQQTSGRRIDLYWDEQAQMNYALACIASNEWVKENFSETISKIENQKNEICLGRLPSEVCEDFILQIFPDSLRRSNIKTITFIKTYFRDASSQSNDHLATFYPRLFLNFISSLSENLKLSKNPFDSARKIDQTAIFESYDKAAKNFINEARQELSHAILLNDDQQENLRQITKLLDALQGQTTPFSLDLLIKNLHAEIGKSVPEEHIRTALLTMKEMGIFESTPKTPTKWRAGRVYKSALRMKFVRGAKAKV